MDMYVYKKLSCLWTGRLVLALALAYFTAACAHRREIRTYTPDALRMELAERVPNIPPSDFMIPFEVDAEHVEMAKKATRHYRTPLQQAEALKDALFSPSVFGLQYENASTVTAREALRQGRGNCVSLASAYVGLARAIGLQAYYIDASERIHDVEHTSKFVVKIGHITAVVYTAETPIALEISVRSFAAFNILSHRWHMIRSMQPMNDIEAVAHFYNNRGYEIIRQAQEEQRTADWNKIVPYFELATKIEPRFYRAWNNLGVAYARLGRYAKASHCYRMAIAIKPDLSSPYFNLGVLYLSAGKVNAAVEMLERATQLDSENSSVHFKHGIALLYHGKTLAAEDAFERATHLRDDHPRARRFFKKLHLYHKRKTELER